MTEKYGRPSKYFDYSDSALAAAMDEAVDYFIRTGKFLTPNDAKLSKNQIPIILPQTTIRSLARKKQHEEGEKNSQKSSTSTNPLAGRLNSGKNELSDPGNNNRCLTTTKMRNFLANTAKARDEAQNGMDTQRVSSNYGATDRARFKEM